jgi:hypothetical protein
MTANFPELAKPGSAITVDWTFQQYLGAHEFVSRSALEDLRNEGPAYYHAKHIARTIQDADSPAMELGRHVHMRLLEPAEWERRVMVWEPLPRPLGAYGRAKAGTDARHMYDVWKANSLEWEAKRDRHARDGGIVISPEHAAKVEAIATGIREHKYGALLLGASGSAEQTVLWHHPDTGVLIRTRFDLNVALDEGLRVVFDLKTTDGPAPRRFGGSVARFGYHRQGALYRDAARALHPGDEIHYVLGVVRSSPPFEVAFYELEAALELGREQYTATLHELVRRREENDWRADWQRGLATLDMPGWAYHEGT